MALLPILEFPDPRLRTVAKPVDDFNDEVGQLVENMLETMYEASGIGLAATQVNVHKRVVVMDLSEDHSQPLVFINPEVEVLDQTPEEYDEGCLSVPGFFETVVRPSAVNISAYNSKGELFEIKADGLLAVCIQHEIDHLNGKLFVDYISPIKRQRIRSKLEKQQRASSE